MRSLIVDLRGNPGGLLVSAVEVVNKFIDRGVVVSTRGRNAQEDFTYTARAEAVWQVPLVLIIDQDSASAAEIFAGAIRDHRRGTIVGVRSYGKGSVQGIFPLELWQLGRTADDRAVLLARRTAFRPRGRRAGHPGPPDGEGRLSGAAGHAGARRDADGRHSGRHAAESERRSLAAGAKHRAARFRTAGQVRLSRSRLFLAFQNRGTTVASRFPNRPIPLASPDRVISSATVENR